MDTKMVKCGHRALIVWQRAMELARESHRLAGRLPKDERFALANQIRRAASSIPANIAEGNGQLYRRAFTRHLSIARGSLMELDTHLELAVMTGYLTPRDIAPALALIGHVARLLAGLTKSLASPPLPPSNVSV